MHVPVIMHTDITSKPVINKENNKPPLLSLRMYVYAMLRKDIVILAEYSNYT